MKYITMLFLLLFISACNDLGSFDYSPDKNIQFHLIMNKSEYFEKHKATYLFFELQIKNTSSGAVYFDPGKVKAKINGKISEGTFYDSLASVMPEKKILKKGDSSYNLYFVLPDIKELASIKEIEIINFGLSQN